MDQLLYNQATAENFVIRTEKVSEEMQLIIILRVCGRTVDILEGLEVSANGGRLCILTSFKVVVVPCQMCVLWMESRAGDGNHGIAALPEDSGSMQPDRIRALVKTVECEEAVLWVAPPPTPLKGQDCFLLPCLGGRVLS